MLRNNGTALRHYSAQEAKQATVFNNAHRRQQLTTIPAAEENARILVESFSGHSILI